MDHNLWYIIPQYKSMVHNFHHVVKKQRNNKAIFGPSWTFKIFFKNRGLSFETLDSDFCDLLDELFHMVEKIFSKIKIAGLISKSNIFDKITSIYQKFIRLLNLFSFPCFG